jgi:hypothetical protein
MTSRHPSAAPPRWLIAAADALSDDAQARAAQNVRDVPDVRRRQIHSLGSFVGDAKDVASKLAARHEDIVRQLNVRAPMFGFSERSIGHVKRCSMEGGTTLI